MSEQEMTAFNELINGFEIVGSLTPEGTSFIKRGVQHLQQENQKLKTSNTIIQEKYKIVDEINQKYKSVIEEVREYIEKSSLEANTREYGMLIVCNSDDLLQILDKAKVGDNNE